MDADNEIENIINQKEIVTTDGVVTRENQITVNGTINYNILYYPKNSEMVCGEEKEINFEELYNRCANLKEVTSKEEKLALMRLGIVFDNVKGILANKNIDIEKDMFGRDIIKYGEKYSFSDRISKEEEEEGIGVKPVKLNDELRKNVRTNEEIALESSKREEIEVKSVEKSKNEEEKQKISDENNLTI